METLTEPLGAKGWVYSLAISPDGNFVGAAVGKTIVIWDIHNGNIVLGPLKGSNKSVRAVEFSPDGRTLASGWEDADTRMWDTETGGQTLAPLRGHTSSVDSIKFSHGGRLLISGSSDTTSRLWDARTGQRIGEPIQAHSIVRSVTISTDGSRIFGALYDNTIKAFDVSTGALLFECVGHTDWVRTVVLSPDGRRIASASGDATVRIWDGLTGHAIGNPLEGHTELVTSVAFTPNGRSIASGSYDQTIRIWDAETGAIQMGPLSGHGDRIQTVIFTPDGRHLLSGSEDRTIRLWDVHCLGTEDSNSGRPSSTEMETMEADITSTTTAEEIVSLLGTRGCKDLTEQLDIASCGYRPFASGGIGDIFRCKMTNGIEVAVKTVRLYAGSNEQNQKHLKASALLYLHTAREIYAWSKCLHLNVQPLLGLAMFREQLAMISLWESNGSLPRYLEQHADVDRCVMSMLIAQGLAYLHTSGVIHGDLKGANVLVSHEGVPQLVDFGNAVLEEYTLQFTQTSTKEALSSRWAAPELFEGASCSTAADVYALGMTILETVTGSVPWIGISERAIMFSVMFNKAFPDRPEQYIPTDSEQGDMLWSLLKKCWEPEPLMRLSASEAKGVMNGITPVGLKRR